MTFPIDLINTYELNPSIEAFKRCAANPYEFSVLSMSGGSDGKWWACQEAAQHGDYAECLRLVREQMEESIREYLRDRADEDGVIMPYGEAASTLMNFLMETQPDWVRASD
jgi:hypothetical protein